MAKQEGLMIHFDEEQRNYLIQNDDEGATFSDALSVPDWDVKQLQVVLLSFTGSTIDYICLATRGNRVVTAKSRVEFFDIVNLHSVPISEVEGLLGPNTKLHFVKSSRGQGGRIPHKTWEAVLEALKQLRQEQAGEIKRLTALKSIARYRLSGEATDILLQEREALGAALDIFSGSNTLRKRVLRSWVPNIDEVQDYDDDNLTAHLSTPEKGTLSFMSGIPSRHIQEESAIQHDLYNWEDEKASFHELGVSTFQQGSRVLEIVYANKNPLEHTLGVDLIYYNQEYHSFVLVQYKLMKDKNDKEGYYYRPDEQLEKEIERMDIFIDKYSSDIKINSHDQYRLNTDGFMFKLVPNRGLQAASEKLISGMYVTREYMEFLLSPYGPKGEKGGRLISFNNSPRYLTNSEFSSSVNRGWIGSNAAQSDALEILIKSFLETGRAILVATEVDIDKNKIKTDTA